MAIFGPAGREILDSSDPATSQRNRETFVVAFAEEWRLEDAGAGRKELVIGHESWPFPVPLVKTPRGWVFDVGRRQAGDSQSAHRTQRARCDRDLPGLREGPACLRQRPVTTASRPASTRSGSPASRARRTACTGQRDEDSRAVRSAISSRRPRRTGQPRDTAQRGPHAVPRLLLPHPDRWTGSLPRPAAPRATSSTGEMTGGFALVAWPAQYDATGVMTFIVNQDGVVYEKDLGPETATKAPASRGTTRTPPGRELIDRRRAGNASLRSWIKRASARQALVTRATARASNKAPDVIVTCWLQCAC